MKDWKNILVSPTTSILKAIEMIDASSMQIALVIDENDRLLGTVTDGDIRRGILKGIPMDGNVQLVMNVKPTVSKLNEGREHLLGIMKTKVLRQIPLVNDEGCVVGVEFLSELIKDSKRDNWVVLMAGGLGSRLGPMTKDCPKPMLRVGNKPVLETILENCKEYGFHKFYISVNYKAEMIERHFGDGGRWGAQITYIREKKKLGTAGALGLLPEKPTCPLLIMNGDVLTKVNFKQLFDFHMEHRADATMCVREYDFQVPYGVVKTDKHKLVSIEEKPLQRFFVNAGIYVLTPKALDFIPKNSFFDMPTLFESLVKQEMETAVFPIREYWLDIGRIDDYDRANGEYQEIFS